MLPSQLNIGGRNFFIKEKNKLKGQQGQEFLGLCFLDKQEIHLIKKFPEESTKAKTFIHEIIHAINLHFNHYQQDHEAEENLTTILANGLNMVFKDNPELVKYLYEVYGAA